MHLGLIDRPFVPHNLISVQENPVPFPKFQMARRLKILMSSGSKKAIQIHYPFHSKSPGKRIPSRFPNGDPMERDTSLQGIFTSLLIYSIYFYLSFRVPGKGAPSMFLNRVPMDRDTPSPEPLIYLVIHSFIHVCLPESPKRSPPAYGEKHKVTFHGAPRRRKANIQWRAAWFPKVHVLKSHEFDSRP